MELNESGGKFKNAQEVDDACEALLKHGGLVAHAERLQSQIVDDGGLRFLASPLDFDKEQRRVIIANLRRAALGGKLAHGRQPVSQEVAERARAMLEPFGLLEPSHKKLFSKIVRTREVSVTSAKN